MAGEAVKGFKFDPGGIGSIFKTYRLKVPTFQREYAWEVEQVDQLLADLNRAKTDHTDHFLGTIVTIESGSQQPLEIVDGQQRLTTTALLITAIRELQSDLGQSQQVIESINSDYLSSFDRRANGPVPKLVLNIDDNEFFAGLVSGVVIDATRESHRRLLAGSKRAKAFVKNVLNGFNDADKPAVLNEWLDFIEHGASVILVRTDDASKAFKMFETLNDRGLKTSQADLVKSYLFGQSGGRIAESQSRWSSMKDALEEIADDDRAINFLRHVLIATRKFVRSEEVYGTVQSTIRGESSTASFLSDLANYARTYVATFQPSADHWREYSVQTARALAVFNRFDLKPIRPLVLSLALKFKPALFETAIKFLVSLSVRLVIAGRTRSGTIEATFASAAIDVFEERITTLAQLKTSLRNVLVGDSDFHSEFTTARVSNAGLARYYLRALESANAGDSEPWYIENDDQSAITLEHVLPQNSGGTWEGLDIDAQKQFVRRLGNLCLLTKNGNENAGNKPFAGKIATYSTSPYALTSMIGGNETWGPTQIEARQARLALIASQAWPL